MCKRSRSCKDAFWCRPNPRSRLYFFENKSLKKMIHNVAPYKGSELTTTWIPWGVSSACTTTAVHVFGRNSPVASPWGSKKNSSLSLSLSVEIQSCLVSSGDVGCGTFQCFNNNSCEIQGLHHICLTLLHNAGRYDSQVGVGVWPHFTRCPIVR